MDIERIGPYRIIKKLGQGGMGAVYEGVHEEIERKVAIKVLHADHASSPENAARFFNEARVVNRIDHPGLVQISDHGQTPDGTIYIVMELLKGETLRQRLKRHDDKLPPRDAVYLTRQIAAALHAAHAQGIIHRDLKPENIMVVKDPELPDGERTKVLDFGVAKLLQATTQAKVKTKTNSLIGTPRYMSPEQCRGRADVDSRADVYSLGVMLYEMLCGEPPFQAKGTGELLAMHIVETPPPLLSRAPATPRPLAELVEQMLHKEKDRRPSMQQIIEALESMMPLVGLTPRSPSLPSTGDQLKLPPVSAALPETATTLLKSSGQRAPLLRLKESRSLLLIVGLGITVGIASYALHGRPETPAGLPASHPAAAVPRTVRWSITTEPDGAEIYSERQLAILGATPWQSEQAAKHGVERLRVRRAGFRDILLELNMDSDEQRRLTLVPLRTVPRPKLPPKAPPKAPAPVKKPLKSNAKRIEVED